MKSTSGSATPTSPASTASSGGKMVAVRVQMLDDSITLFQVQTKAPGRILFEQVCKQLNLLEVDYFGLEYQDSYHVTYWLDLDKQMNHQLGLLSASSSGGEPLLRFCVKFYTPDPAQIEEEYTRYLYSLQVKRDLAAGALQCNDNTAALMASYIVQAECGDYVVEDYPDHTYLSSFKFVPQQDSELERRIMENHKKHTGQPPAEADLNLLETARRCELYGIKMHSAKDHEGVPLNLSVAHLGVVVFQNFTKINTFSWAKIRKLSFKRKRFLIKLHPEGYPEGYYKDTVEFYFEDRNHCKNFWKKCVEHHSFFRCSQTIQREREKRRLLSRGSSFRYSGKTQKQMQEYVRENFVKRQSFQRHVRNLHASMGNVGQSFSAQPLLPIGDNGVDHQTNGDSSPTLPPPTSPYQQQPITNIYQQQQGSNPQSPGSYQSAFANNLSRETFSPTDNHISVEQQRQQLSPQHSQGVEIYEQQRRTEMTTSTPLGGGGGHHAHGPAHGANHSGGHAHLHNNHYSHLYSPATGKFLREDSVDGTLSPVSSKSAGTEDAITDPEQLFRNKKRYPADRPYFIAKEILMTERTYKKDLEIINLWFRDEVTKEDEMPEELLTLLFSHIDPIYEAHCRLLKEIENNMASWEDRGNNAPYRQDCKNFGDILLRAFDVHTIDRYVRYLEVHAEVLESLEDQLNQDTRFQQVYKDFETQKVCYLPLTTLLLKPLHRILHYNVLLERLMHNYNSNHPDYQSAHMAMIKMQTLIKKMENQLQKSENFVKLAEIQRDVGPSYDGLLSAPGRQFIREGCLQKLSRRGYQQRMFFLFSDLLLYSNRTTNPTLHFRVHGHLQVKDLSVIESEPRLGAEHCFNIYDGKKALLVAASNQEEKIQWMEAIADAAQAAKVLQNGDDNSVEKNRFMSLKSISGSEDALDRSETGTLDSRNLSSSATAVASQRTNSSVHVCWHRSTTTSREEYHVATRNLLSGYLLRKFKNSNGWQKLWVVFTNSCLYFFKTFQDDFPLASLPLLGYSVEKPTEADQIQKDFVFKLVFKNHVYFFRAESQYTFERWIEVLADSTKISDELGQLQIEENGDGGIKNGY